MIPKRVRSTRKISFRTSGGQVPYRQPLVAHADVERHRCTAGTLESGRRFQRLLKESSAWKVVLLERKLTRTVVV